MVKMYPLLLLAAFGRRISARMIALCAGIIAGGYALYASVGAGVLGFLSGFTHEEGMDTGDRYFLLAWTQRYLHLPFWPGMYLASSTLVLAALGIWAALRYREPKETLGLALAISVVATILFSPHYPWYFIWIVPLAVMLRYLPAIVLTLSASYWFTTELALPGEGMFRLNEYMYGTFVAAVLVDLAVRSLLNTRPLPGLTRIGKTYEEHDDSTKPIG
jgi:hypothetical protein